MSRTCSADASTNTPTDATYGGNAATTAAAVGKSISRLLLACTIIPTASAPAAAAAAASAGLVTPQNLMRIRDTTITLVLARSQRT